MSADTAAKAAFEQRGKRVLQAMLIAVAVCVILDRVFAALLPPPAQAVYYRTARALIASDEAPDVQIIGDSAAERALVAAAFAPGDDVYVRNDALNGARLSFTYYLLRTQFERGHVPGAIVIAHTPSLEDVRTSRLLAEFANVDEIPDMLSATTNWSDASFGLLARSSYILGAREHFRALIVGGNYGFFVVPPERNGYVPHSDAAILEKFAASSKAALPAARFEEIRGIRPFNVDGDTDLYLRKLLALAKQNGVRVFWLTMPVPKIVADVHERFGNEAKLVHYLAELEQSAGLTVLEGRFAVYDDELFQDTVHATPAGAVQISCDARRFAPLIRAAFPARDTVSSPKRAARLAEQRRVRQALDELCPASVEQRLSGAGVPGEASAGTVPRN